MSGWCSWLTMALPPLQRRGKRRGKGRGVGVGGGVGGGGGGGVGRGEGGAEWCWVGVAAVCRQPAGRQEREEEGQWPLVGASLRSINVDPPLATNLLTSEIRRCICVYVYVTTLTFGQK